MSGRTRTFVRQAAGALGPIVPTIVLISGVVNLLALTGSFYMLQIYDRVLTCRSLPSLLALSILAIVLYLFQGVLDIIRAQVMQRLASRVDRRLSPRQSGVSPRVGLAHSQHASHILPTPGLPPAPDTCHRHHRTSCSP